MSGFYGEDYSLPTNAIPVDTAKWSWNVIVHGCRNLVAVAGILDVVMDVIMDVMH